MKNSYPGYCIDCKSDVRKGHGELKKQNGKYVVSCGRGAAAPVPAAPVAAKAEPERPVGMRLSNLRLSNANASLTVRFAVDGVGDAQVSAGRYSMSFTDATAYKYKEWGPWPFVYDASEGLLRESGCDRKERITSEEADRRKKYWEDNAAAHNPLAAANEALLAMLTGQKKIVREDEYKFEFLLSLEEEAALRDFVAAARRELLDAIVDGSAAIRVEEVGCDYRHPQVCGIRLPGAQKDVEYALIQDVLGELRLKVDGREECKDLQAAVRAAQAKIDEANAAKAEHKAKRTAGYHLVAVSQCWECGRTKILGEFDDEMALVRMPEAAYRECVAEQRKGHSRSLAAVPAGTILSSVGFSPDPESSYEFRVIDNEYCGC